MAATLPNHLAVDIERDTAKANQDRPDLRLEYGGSGLGGRAKDLVDAIPPGGEARFVAATCDLSSVTDEQRRDPNFAVAGLFFCAFLTGNPTKSFDDAMAMVTDNFSLPPEELDNVTRSNRAANEHLCPQAGRK